MSVKRITNRNDHQVKERITGMRYKVDESELWDMEKEKIMVKYEHNIQDLQGIVKNLQANIRSVYHKLLCAIMQL